jgi:DNA replication protein
VIGEPHGNSIPLARTFFESTLPKTRDLAELKAVLHVAVTAHDLNLPAVGLDVLLSHAVLRSIAPDVSPEPAEARVRQALERAVVNGALLQLRVGKADSARLCYLLNTEESRALIARLSAGDASASAQLGIDGTDPVEVYRPNAFALYERWIGPLSPLLADRLRDAERLYPREWIEAALREAAAHEHRSWRYIEEILSRWEREGGPARLSTKR